MAMTSDVQVFVRFKERCVFAGEDFNCTITFKHVSHSQDRADSSFFNRAGQVRQSKPASQHGRGERAQPRVVPGKNNTHSKLPGPLSSLPPREAEQDGPSPRPDFKHQRSISIVSIGSPKISTSPDKSSSNLVRNAAPGLGHRRSSTVQHFGRVPSRSSPFRQLTTDLRPTAQNGRKSPLSQASSSNPGEPVSEFKFPPDHRLNANTPESAQGTPILAPRKGLQHRNISGIAQSVERRDSMDIYNHSNNSQETMMSEQPSIMSERPQMANVLPRQLLQSDAPQGRLPQATSLLMGYAQVNATFTLDASLVDQTPFEEVKKKGFLGGQAGGGVVGVKKKTRPTSGFFSGLGFSSLGESLESMIGGDSLSSVREMKAITNSRAIPLLSTPQSLLFVDLHLEPGDEKSYSFTMRIPKGLPSSYRGKAIKIVYNLTIGVQGAPGNKEMQAVRQVTVPIRVFSGVDSDGEIFGHDLMQPYVILKDVATTKSIELNGHDAIYQSKSETGNKISSTDFLQYVDNLLDTRRRRQSSSGTIDAMFGTFAPEKSAAVRAINRAIMLSNHITAASESSPNRFEIARSGMKIATVILDRPLHRLGEAVTTIVDLSEGQMTCTSLRATLETAERVSNSLAVRSATAVNRITKKVYASSSENILFANRAVFSPTIPISATPTFVTSGVNLEWYVKLEFGTVHSIHDEMSSGQYDVNLLEEVVVDERGKVSVAVESLDCDTFEVLIPITVFGDIVVDGKDGDDVVGIPI